MSVDFYFSRIEHDPLHPNRRRVRAFRRFDIANIFRDEIEPGDPQRFKRTFVRIGQIAVLNGKSIDEAFYQAQEEMRKKYSPFYWAAFVLVE